jgi:hypothetical protein
VPLLILQVTGSVARMGLPTAAGVVAGVYAGGIVDRYRSAGARNGLELAAVGEGDGGPHARDRADDGDGGGG